MTTIAASVPAAIAAIPSGPIVAAAPSPASPADAPVAEPSWAVTLLNVRKTKTNNKEKMTLQDFFNALRFDRFITLFPP